MDEHRWKDLTVWQKSHELVLKLYQLTNIFPELERYNLTDQIRRAGTSLATNIVEGHDRGSSAEFKRFLFISRGSLEEIRYLILLSRDLQYINDSTYKEIEECCSIISKMINKLIKSIG